MYKLKFNDPIHIHFIGIGGISMSGLAEILLEKGFTISGSDAKESDLTRMLASKGAQIFYGQSAENIIPGIDLVVYTAAIHPDNPEFAAAKAKGIPMAVASSSSLSIIDKVLDKLALREYFTLIATGDEVPASKPAPDIFLLAAQRLGCKPEACWVIEDSYNGVTAAKAAGMHCIGFYNPHSGNQDISAADHRIEHIAEAMGILGLEG